MAGLDVAVNCHVFMKGLEESAGRRKGKREKEKLEDGCHALKIWHAADPRVCWEIDIDGERCIVDPPKLLFDDMPEEVTLIKA